MEFKLIDTQQPDETNDDDHDELTSEDDANTHQAKRRPEYPNIGAQLDDLYKQGVFSADMAAKIKAVKDKYPKPS